MKDAVDIRPRLSEQELAALCTLLRDLWSDRQRVVAATANFIGKNKDFQQVHNALLKHLDQTGKCLEAFYSALGGTVAELRRK